MSSLDTTVATYRSWFATCNVRGVSAGRYTRFPALTARVRTRTEKHSAVTDREVHKRRETVLQPQLRERQADPQKGSHTIV